MVRAERPNEQELRRAGLQAWQGHMCSNFVASEGNGDFSAQLWAH